MCKDCTTHTAPAGSYTRTDEDWQARAEKAERALVEMTAHRDRCRDTAIKWQVAANRAGAEQPREGVGRVGYNFAVSQDGAVYQNVQDIQPRPLTPDAIESVLHDILPLTANRLGEDDIASIASDLYLALTEPQRPAWADLADTLRAIDPGETLDIDDLAEAAHERGVRVTGAES